MNKTLIYFSVIELALACQASRAITAELPNCHDCGAAW